MSKLPLPLGSVLREGYGEADVKRVWRNIQRRSASVGERRITARWALAGGALAAAFALVVLLAWPRRPVAVGPLEMAEGGRPSVLLVAATEPGRQVILADGSRIELGSDSRLDVLANNGAAFVTALRRGRSHFAHRELHARLAEAQMQVISQHTQFRDVQSLQSEVDMERHLVL